MGDILCKIMGVLDITAGVLIMIAFSKSYFSIFFGIIMLIKGAFSFI